MTRRIVITQNVTLDGVVEALDWFDASGDAENEGADQLADMRAQMARQVGFLVGRDTFESMRGFWPHQIDDETGVTAHLNEVEKFVVSTTMSDPAWEPTTILRGGVGLAEDIARVRKEGPDGDVGVTGSISLCHDLLHGGLVDEVRLLVYPVVLGRGRRLFPDGFGTRNLRLVESRAFSNGVSLQVYGLAPRACVSAH